MGYYTSYSISIHRGELPIAPLPWDEQTLADALNRQTAANDGEEFKVVFNEIRSVQPYKWYRYAEDMAAVTKRLGQAGCDVVLAVYGEGEEAGDLWVHYFHPDGSDSGRLKARIEYLPDPTTPPGESDAHPR